MGGVYIVFNDSKELKIFNSVLYRIGCPRSQVVTLREFNHLPLDSFRDIGSDIQLLSALKNFSVKTLLDADAHFAKSRLFTKAPNDFTQIDCVCREELLPIKENIYSRVYKDFSACALKHYDAALITERTPADFDNAFLRLQNTADIIITFARHGSALENHIRNAFDRFKQVTALPNWAGHWFFCRVQKPPEDFAMYVVTHKNLPPEHVQRLPEGYRVIHAGHALAARDFGYLPDDTGDNISALNPYLNELTALYWIWKNTNHTIAGLSHYRRFFTANAENFLTRAEAVDLLDSYDIITDKFSMHRAPTHEILSDDIGGDELTTFAENVIRQNLMRRQPDYLDAFNCKMNSPMVFFKNMFVTRRPVFDAYCEWLFSFMIDSTREVLQRTPLAKMAGNARRLMGHFAERMMTVWLSKNRLRIKEISIVEVKRL